MSLMDNPIANLRGPEFLAVYAVFIVIVLVWTFRAARRPIAASIGTIPIPSNPDPLEIAYLRTGSGEVVRTAIIDLIDRGHLEHVRGFIENWLKLKTQPTVDLGPIRRAVLDYFGEKGRSLKSAFMNRQFRAQINAMCAPWRESHQEAELTVNAAHRRAAAHVAMYAVVAIAAPGLYKLWVALERGRSNYGFLIMFCVFGCILAIVMTILPRLTNKGKEYMRQLRLAFSDFQRVARPPGFGTGASPQPMTGASGSDWGAGLASGAALGMGVFGIAALSDYADARVVKDLRQASSSSGCSGGGCGWAASCGGSSSGCGSGGSGDGGGGCGGCGGGD